MRKMLSVSDDLKKVDNPGKSERGGGSLKIHQFERKCASASIEREQGRGNRRVE